MIGAKVARGKWIRGKLRTTILTNKTEIIYICTNGTKLVWNSFKSTLREPSKRNEAVIEETTWAISLFKLVRLGEVIPRFFLQIS